MKLPRRGRILAGTEDLRGAKERPPWTEIRGLGRGGHYSEYGPPTAARTDPLAGQRVTRAGQGGRPGYDNRLASLSRNGAIFASLGYDLGGRRKSVLLKNGARTEFEFNRRDETTRVKTVSSSGQVLASYAYGYNDRGERTSIEREHLGERVNFSYDCGGRLIGESSTGNGGGGGFVCQNFFEPSPGGNESADSTIVSATPTASPVALSIPARSLSWTYDRAGNRIAQTVNGESFTYQHDAENRLTREINSDVVDFAYDANGNQTSRTKNGVAETFAYDYANRLVSYTRGGSAFAYAYAPSGERFRKTNVSAGTSEWYMYDGADVVSDYTQSGSGALALQTSYVQPGSIDSKIARILPDGTEHFYVPDALGSVTHLLDASQAIVNSEVTDAWGNVVASSRAVSDRYGYTGRELDEGGLMHFRARSYDLSRLRGVWMAPGGVGRPSDASR